MDTKLIQQYGEDILCYRIRTVRQRKRMRYEDFGKQLIRLHKEERKLFLQKKNVEWERLEPAIQVGWKRFFVLRQDIAKGRQAAFYENILAKINTKDWSHRRDFKIRKRKKGRKIYVVKRQQLLQPDENHFMRLNFSDIEKKFFQEEYFFLGKKGAPIKRYVFKEPERFELRIRPNMVDKVKKRNNRVESRLTEIKNFLERNDYEKRQARLLRGKYQWKYWKDSENFKEKYFFKNKSVQYILDKSKEG